MPPLSLLFLLASACRVTGDRPDEGLVTWGDDGVEVVPGGSGAGDGGTGDSGAGDGASAVVIDELMPGNDSTVEDEHGDEDDWVELRNASASTVDLAGWTLTDRADDAPHYAFASGTTLGPGERLLVWLDDDPVQGPLHAPFTLPVDGGRLALVDPDGRVADAWTWPEVPSDIAFARFPGDLLAPTRHATPGAPNPDAPGASLDPSDALFPDPLAPDPLDPAVHGVLALDLALSDDALVALAADPDTWVEGAISFDGVTLSPVGVRLKGSTGSARTLDEKAAFKVKLTEYGGERLRGLEELTLNNMVQDASLVHEQLAYTTFRDARVPAPRVAYAAVTLNGEARGVYLHVESPDRTFLARWYADPDGDLYEGGAHIDLDTATYEQLEVDETGSDPDAATDLAALAALLATDPDEGDVATLETLVDLDELLTMWATEVLLGHWDGYFWFPHNYRVYHDPSTRRFTMLPWGADLTLQEVRSCFHAKGALAVWALRIPSVLDRYVAALGEAADHVDGLPLAADAEALHAVVAPLDDPYAEFTEEESDAELARAVDFVTVWPEAVRDGITTGVDPGSDHVP